MSVMKSADVCPACLEKLVQHIQKAQEEILKREEQGKKEVEKTEGKYKEKDEVEDKNGPEYKKATQEELGSCLKSLSGSICRSCLSSRNISIVKLPPDAFSFRYVPVFIFLFCFHLFIIILFFFFVNLSHLYLHFN